MSGNCDLPILHQHWIHSHEEDTEDEVVYRPSHYDFPPARGRKGIELFDDGTLVEYAVGATDRPVGKHGRWKLVGDQMALYDESDGEPTGMLKIKSLNIDKLVVRKHAQCKTP